MNKHYRILFILHLPPPVHGAAMMGEYIKGSRLINQAYDCNYINLTMASSIENVGKISLQKFLPLFKLLQAIRREVKERHPDLVYITPNAKGNAFFKEWIIVKMLKRMGCRIVAHYHNKGVSSVHDKYVYNWLYKSFFKNLKIIILADCLYDDIKKYVKREDVFICPNGILDNHPIKKINSKPDRIILFLSNLIRSKGVVDLLDACKMLKEQGFDFSCTFVGAESKEITKTVFEEYVRQRGLQNYIQYAGPKYGSEKMNIIQQSDIFVFPSYYPKECFPLVLLEAMEYSLPCISTNEGAIPEIIDDGETGYVICKNDVEQLSRKICELMNNEDLQLRMGTNAREKFERLYTLDKFESRLKEILENILLN